MTSNISGSVGGKQAALKKLIEFSPRISELSLCRDVDFSQQAERVCPLLCGNEVDLIHILLSSCENAFHLLRNTANVM